MRSTDRPRILLYAGGFARLGGIEVYTRDLARLLTENGCDVTLAWWPIRGGGPLTGEMKSMGVRLIRGPVTRGVTRDLPDRFLFPFARREIRRSDLVILLKLFSRRVMRDIMREADAGRLDAAASPVPRAVPTLFVPSYCPEEDETWTYTPMPEPEVLNRISAFQPQCGRMAAQCANFLGYRGRMDVFPLLHSLRNPPVSPLPSAGPGKPVIMTYMGRLSWQKNVEALIDAFEVCEETRKSASASPEIQFHIHGGGDLESALRERAARGTCAGKIRFHGSYSTENIPRIAAASHFFVQATRFEGQCLAALEVLSCGRYLVATRAGCLPEVLGGGRGLGEIVEPGDARAMAQAMLRAADLVTKGGIHPEGIAESCRGRFGFDVVAPRMMDLVRSLIDNR